MKHLRFLIVFFCVCIHTLILSQNDSEKDSTYIKVIKDKAVFKINASTRTDSYLIRNSENNTLYRLEPNSDVRLNLSFNYDFLSLSFGATPKFLSGNEGLKGKSKLKEFHFRFFFNRLVQNLHYETIKGYYVENTEDFILNWQEGRDAYIQYPNFKNIDISGATAYLFNPNFSLKSLIHHTEFQQKSAGSFIPKLTYSYNKFSNKIEQQESIEKAFQIELATAYYYNFVIKKKWIIAPYISPSVGYRFSNYELKGNPNNSKEKYNTHIVSLKGGARLGYNSTKLFFGLNAHFEASDYKENLTTSVQNDDAYTNLYFGIRFTPPKFVKKPIDWVNKKLKL